MKKIISTVVGIGTIIWIWNSRIISGSIAEKMTATVLMIMAVGLDIFDPYGITKKHKYLFNWVLVVFFAAMLLFGIVSK